MSDVRCRACGAGAPEGAQWCSLCFADLRQPTVREPVSVPAAPPLAQAVVAQPAPVATSPGASQPLAATVRPAAAPAAAAAVAATKPGKPAIWPCPRCGAQVPIALDACQECGAGFLAGAASQMSTHLPLVGDMAKMSSGMRYLVALGGAAGLVVLLFVIAIVAGHIF